MVLAFTVTANGVQSTGEHFTAARAMAVTGDVAARASLEPIVPVVKQGTAGNENEESQ